MSADQFLSNQQNFDASFISNKMLPNYRALVATIAADGDKTSVIDCRGFTLYALELPSGFEGTSITFEATLSDADDATYVPVTDDAGNTYTVLVGESEVVILDVQKMAGLRKLKIVSSATETAEREIRCGLRAV
jgi:hypothetical protein